MKRFLPFLITAFLILLLAACSGNKGIRQIDAANKGDTQAENSDTGYEEELSENKQPYLEGSEAVQSVFDASGDSTPRQEESGIDVLIEIFEDNDYSAVLESTEPQLLRGNRFQVFFSGPSEGCITIYEYQDSLRAQEDAACIDGSGSTLYWPDKTQYIEWKSVPHFWRQDNLIIQYIGVDEAVLQLLTELYGEQFAGGFDGLGEI